MKPAFSYRVYGLAVASDIELPELQACRHDGPHDLAIRMGDVPEHLDEVRHQSPWFQANAPTDAVLYHQELGSQYRFYLFDQTQEHGGYDLRWTPSAVYLADNAAKTPTLRKFMIQPDWAATRDQARYLPMRDMAWLPRFHAGKFTVYEIMAQPPCGDAKYATQTCSSRVRDPAGASQDLLWSTRRVTDPARATGSQPGGAP